AWGCAVNTVIKNKGYKENWFWWGFFFGIIALIVACTRPNLSERRIYQEQYNAYRDNKTIKTGGWKCPHCGSLNASYVGTCGCGREKPKPVVNEPKNEKQTEIKNDLERLNMIKEYKSLLDSGIITQEEFDKKKAELIKL
ncbi:MAG: SHOCT domain-containing protein, partial [Firmicutes bacterium]|nr:SHOCT domain-containing protein [Bacillota bacterium]